MLVIAGITGGLLTRALSSEGLRKESVLSKIGSWIGLGKEGYEDDDE